MAANSQRGDARIGLKRDLVGMVSFSYVWFGRGNYQILICTHLAPREVTPTPCSRVIAAVHMFCAQPLSYARMGKPLWFSLVLLRICRCKHTNSVSNLRKGSKLDTTWTCSLCGYRERLCCVEIESERENIHSSNHLRGCTPLWYRRFAPSQKSMRVSDRRNGDKSAGLQPAQCLKCSC